MSYQPSPDTRLEKGALTSDHTITLLDVGKLLTNKGAAGNIVITLPLSMEDGAQFVVANDEAGKSIAFFPEGGGQIVYGNTDADELGTVAKIVHLGSGDYLIEGVPLAPELVLGGILSGGHRSSYFLEESTGTMWSWGRNNTGVGNGGFLGDNTLDNRSSPVSVVNSGVLAPIFISGGVFASYLLDSSGFAWSFGNDFSGQLGTDTSNVHRSSPVSVVGGHVFKYIHSGGSTSITATAAIDTDGYAWMWGEGPNGDDTNNFRSSPVSVVGANKFKQIDTHAAVTAALDEDGHAWCWGYSVNGAMGDNANAGRSSPVSVVGDRVFKTISTSSLGVVARDLSDFGWWWGDVSVVTPSTSVSSPVSLLGGHRWKKLLGGGQAGSSPQHLGGIDRDGYVWMWGENSNGQCGDNTNTDRNSPVSVVGGRKFIDLALGDLHAIALEKDTGVVWGWGLNQYGALGTDDLTGSSSPVSVVKVFTV